MTKQEAMKLLYVIKASYVRHFDKFTNQDMSSMADAWAFALSDITYESASIGLRVYMASERDGFPPSVGQIIDCYNRTLQSPEEEVTAAEAWEYVWKAITNLRWEEPELEFNKLPKKVQKVIGTASSLREIARMDSNDVMIGEKARFIHAYDAYTEREKDYMRIPEGVRKRIKLADNSEGWKRLDG